MRQQQTDNNKIDEISELNRIYDLSLREYNGQPICIKNLANRTTAVIKKKQNDERVIDFPSKLLSYIIQLNPSLFMDSDVVVAIIYVITALPKEQVVVAINRNNNYQKSLLQAFLAVIKEGYNAQLATFNKRIAGLNGDLQPLNNTSPLKGFFTSSGELNEALLINIKAVCIVATLSSLINALQSMNQPDNCIIEAITCLKEPIHKFSLDELQSIIRYSWELINNEPTENPDPTLAQSPSISDRIFRISNSIDNHPEILKKMIKLAPSFQTSIGILVKGILPQDTAKEALKIQIESWLKAIIQYNNDHEGQSINDPLLLSASVISPTYTINTGFNFVDAIPDLINTPLNNERLKNAILNGNSIISVAKLCLFSACKLTEKIPECIIFQSLEEKRKSTEVLNQSFGSPHAITKIPQLEATDWSKLIDIIAYLKKINLNNLGKFIANKSIEDYIEIHSHNNQHNITIRHGILLLIEILIKALENMQAGIISEQDRKNQKDAANTLAKIISKTLFSLEKRSRNHTSILEKKLTVRVAKKLIQCPQLLLYLLRIAQGMFTTLILFAPTTKIKRTSAIARSVKAWTEALKILLYNALTFVVLGLNLSRDIFKYFHKKYGTIPIIICLLSACFLVMIGKSIAQSMSLSLTSVITTSITICATIATSAYLFHLSQRLPQQGQVNMKRPGTERHATASAKDILPNLKTNDTPILTFSKEINRNTKLTASLI